MTPDALDDRPAAPLENQADTPPDDRSARLLDDPAAAPLDVSAGAPHDHQSTAPHDHQSAAPHDHRSAAPHDHHSAALLGKDARTVPSASAWRVRSARPTDLPRIHALVRELAVYEREPDAVKATTGDLGAAFFNPHPRVHCHVVEVERPDGPSVVGLAIWFVSFSTWRGRHGLWLEDLYVQPAYRGLGAGRALLTELAAICADRGYARMEWAVLDWNEPAQDFYRGVGADPQEDWTVWRITDESLKALGNRPR
jgi:GNAT superfamily N-acetyltransferase